MWAAALMLVKVHLLLYIIIQFFADYRTITRPHFSQIIAQITSAFCPLMKTPGKFVPKMCTFMSPFPTQIQDNLGWQETGAGAENY